MTGDERLQFFHCCVLIDRCLTSSRVKQEILAYVGPYRETSQPEEVFVERGGDSVVPEQPVCWPQQSQDQPPIQANIPRPANLLRPSCRDGLARKIAEKYQPLVANGVRNAVEKGW